MEIKILQVFYDKNGLPYKDKERTVHYPITSGTFLGASNTTQIRFYFDELVEEDDETTSWVVVSKLPNGKIGSEIVETELDEELNEHYALFSLKNFYTQAKGDLFLSLQGYQGGVQVETDPATGISQIVGTPTIQATGSIKLAINYATQLVGSGETANINFQKILADLGTKLGIRAYTERVTELPTTGQTNVFYAIYDDPNDPNKLNIYVWNETTKSYVWVGDNTLDLGNYYTQEQGNQFENGIDNRVTSVENELSSVASGSPKGVYATKSALETADPNHSYIYLVTADGKWYYYDTQLNEWTAGGVYMSTNGKVMQTYAVADYNDCNNVPTNSIITIITPYTYANAPTGFVEGTLLTFNQYSNVADSAGSTQICIDKIGKMYFRIKWATWSNWSNVNEDLTGYMKPYPQGDYNNCNSVPANSIITVILDNLYSNLPAQKEGTLLTFNQYSLSAGGIGSTQIFIGYDNTVYTRIKWGDVWTAWNCITDLVRLGYGLSSTYTDLNNVPAGLVITYTSPLTSYSNLPSNKEGTLFTFGAYQRNNNNGSSQLFVDTSGDVWTRIKWGSWSTWKKTNASENIYTKVRYKDFIYEKYSFHNKSSLWVGDSITRGETIGGVVVENPGAKLFSEYCEMSYTNIAVGGSRFTGETATILGQLTNNQLRNTDYIFIGAGVNDCLANASISDFKTAVNNVIDYIVANYDSNVKVFFITPIRNFTNSTNNDKLYEYRNAITECVIAKNNNRFNVIQGDKFDFPLYESDSTYKTSMSEDGLHPTQLGYSTAYLRGLIKALIL